MSDATRLNVEQVACQVPNGTVRESADGTVPLSYISAIKGGWSGVFVSQPIFIPSGEHAYPTSQEVVLASEGYASVRDIHFFLRYKPSLIGTLSTDRVFISVRFIIANSPPTNIYDTDNIPLCGCSMVLDNMTGITDSSVVHTRHYALADIDRVHVPEGYNVYACIHSNLTGVALPLFGQLDLNWWSVLDDK